MAEFDAIVVGAGPNGLAAALRLAEAGWSVCLVEATAEVGGGARTVECTLPGFRHDFGAGFFPLAAAAPAIAGRPLAGHGLRFLHAPLPAAHPFAGDQAIALGRTTGETADSIDKVHLGDGEAWSALDRDWGDVLGPFLAAQMRRWPVRELAWLLRRLGPRGTADLTRVVLAGADTLARGFASDQARAFLVAPAMHADLPPEAPGSGVYALLLGLLGQRNGMPVAAGGTGAITRALAAALLEAGGTIATGRPVERFVVRSGRAVGVEAGGDAIGARRAVIATIDPRLVVDRTGAEHFPASALAQLRASRPGLGTFKVDWALDGQVPWSAEPCRRAAVVHVADTVTDMSRAVWEAAHGLLPARPTLVLGQQSLADPARAPAGRHTLWGYAHVPAEPAGDAARPRARGGWARAAQPFLDRVEAAIERYAPGFRELILARKVWTPADLEAADPNLVGGDISGGTFAIDQQLLFRPGPAWWRWGTPLKGLYLGGAALPPGGGVHGAAGDQAAAQALADARRPARVALVLAGGATLLAAAAGRRSRT
ncbi:MAG TPA: NAD(P)/FAD-dependent oxidoreductase [Actinomycetes bacterium]|nr:NAD(P)/FAD-dependent oxidoreductase [Actinomycetes bacterium]